MKKSNYSARDLKNANSKKINDFEKKESLKDKEN